MSFQYDINKRLSREHRDVTRELAAVEKHFLNPAGPDSEPNWAEPDTRQLMQDLQFIFESEIPNHFAIEEEELFPLLKQNGLGDMVGLLLDEHRIILDLIRTVLPIISQAATAGKVGKEDWHNVF